MGITLDYFVEQLDARLERAGHLSHNQKARALGVDPATWSRVRHGSIRFSPGVVQAGLALFPDLNYYLSQPKSRAAA